MNAEIEDIVKRQNELRTAIDQIVLELEGESKPLEFERFSDNFQNGNSHTILPTMGKHGKGNE